MPDSTIVTMAVTIPVLMHKTKSEWNHMIFVCVFVLTYKQLYMFYRELYLWIYRIIEKM